MSYVDAFFDRENDVIKIVERNLDGEREFRDVPVKHTFYYKDPKGKHTSIHGDPVSRIVCKNTKDFRKEISIASGKQIYEATSPFVERVYLTRMKGAWWADTRINLERYLLGFRLKSVWPGDNCTFEIWDRELFFG